MRQLFEVLFWIGIAYTALMFVFGALLDGIGFGHHDIHTGGMDGHLDHDMHIHVEDHGIHGIHGWLSGYFITLMKPTVLAVFLTTFGGVGLLGLNNNLNIYVIFALAALAGFILSFIIHKFILTPLYKIQNKSLVVKDGQAIGKMAKVIINISPDKTGSIDYVVGTTQFQSSAKSTDNSFIGSGETVVIEEIKDNVCYVSKVNSKTEKLFYENKN